MAVSYTHLIKALYKKKNYLNKLLFNAHLKVLNSIHPIIINEVLEVIHRQIRNIAISIVSRHNKIYDKLDREQNKADNIICKHKFYKRVDKMCIRDRFNCMLPGSWIEYYECLFMLAALRNNFFLDFGPEKVKIVLLIL